MIPYSPQWYTGLQLNAITWPYSLTRIDQIDHIFFGFDIPKKLFKLILILKAIQNERTLLKVKQLDL